jgi:hypothetical protein
MLTSPALQIDVDRVQSEIDAYCTAINSGRYSQADGPRRRLEVLGLFVLFQPGKAVRPAAQPAAGAGRVATVGTGNAKPEGGQPSGSRGPDPVRAKRRVEPSSAQGKRPAGENARDELYS